MKKLEQIKKENRGKWIALRDSEIIAMDEDYHELHKLLKEKNVRDVYVIYSPSPEDERYETML